jgi:putative ABC transport system permease protein
LLLLLSFICIFISMLGLVGLSAFTAVQRTKEIGIRKVLGASIPEVILLLSKDCLLLVVLSSLFAVPFSWWVVTKWLAKFAYQAELNYLLYIIVTLVALVLVFLVVLFQSIRTANSKAVDSLKYE